MSFPKQPNKALDLLAQLVPSEVLKRGREISQEIEREEYVRRYIEARAFVVAFVGAATSIVLLVIIAVTISKLGKIYGPIEPWLRWSVIGFGLVVLLGLITAFMHLILSALRRSALAELEEDQKASEQFTNDST